MHVRIDHLLLGYCEFLVKAEQSAAFLNVCHALSCPYEWLGTRENAFCVRCLTHRYAAMARACEAAGVVLTPMRRAGLPAFLCRYRRRVGILVGGIVAAMVFYLASNVVWDVRVEGEGGVNAVQLKRELSLCGLSVGTFIPSLDTDEVESRLVTTSGDVAWVSVNRKGTVAYVQVRPLLKPEAVDSAGATVNLVASQDGVVESVRLMAGDVAIRPGDVVRKGQLLIAGVRDIREDGFVLTEARGEVLARTTHTLTVEIPLVYEQKTYTGAPKAEKTLFFFGKAIKITKNAGIMGESCDIIRKMENFTLFGRRALPISMETVHVMPYEMTTRTLTPEEAEALAYEQLWQRLTLATSGGTLLSRRVEGEVTDEVCRLVCTYTCVENIAIPLPFAAEESESVS
jgi:similar to stage IV sporulation protein